MTKHFSAKPPKRRAYEYRIVDDEGIASEWRPTTRSRVEHLNGKPLLDAVLAGNQPYETSVVDGIERHWRKRQPDEP